MNCGMHRSFWIAVVVVLVTLGWVASQRTVLPEAASRAPTIATDVAQASTAAEQRVPETAARSNDTATRYPAFLPPQAHEVLTRIEQGGPFAYRQDGGVFQNRERRLPAQPRGYYREYTVDTPGSRDRGPRRIVTGGDPVDAYWYTDDHYRSFRRFEVRRESR